MLLELFGCSPNMMMWFMMVIVGPSEALNSLDTKYVNKHRAEIVVCAKELQILPNYAENYFLFSEDADDVIQSIVTLRENYEELKDIPKVEDFNPKWLQWRKRNEKNNGWEEDSKQIYEWRRFNREYKKILEERLLWEKDREDIILAAIAEADMLYEVWDAISDLNNERMGNYEKRVAYKKLKRLLGDEMFNSEKLPDFVPIWRFQQK